jgi:hypothetical protein
MVYNPARGKEGGIPCTYQRVAPVLHVVPNLAINNDAKSWSLHTAYIEVTEPKFINHSPMPPLYPGGS